MPAERTRSNIAKGDTHDDVLVVGGGISGIQASLDLAETGFKVYLVDKSPAIGGKMSQLDKTFPTNDCSMCIESPKFIECDRQPNIEIMTYTEVAGVEDVGAHLEDVVTFHDGCHGLRELGVKDAPRRLLANVRGLELREMKPAEECCGFGGTFAVKFAELSGAMANTKIEAILGTGARTVVSLDPSCLMQIQGALSRAGSDVRTMHLAEVLASR